MCETMPLGGLTFAERFKLTYPELSRFEDIRIEAVLRRVSCMFPVITEASGLSPCRYTVAAMMVVAHFLVMEEVPTGLEGMASASSGSSLVTSASVGDVSISKPTPPINDMYDYFFGDTIYGLEFLAFLASIGGLRYVN